jgi:YD repeat-containing protein
MFGGDRVPEHLVPEDLAAYWTGRPTTTIRRWAAEGRLTRHHDPARRRNGVLYDLAELPEARRDADTRRLIAPGPTPGIIETAPLLAA